MSLSAICSGSFGQLKNIKLLKFHSGASRGRSIALRVPKHILFAQWPCRSVGSTTDLSNQKNSQQFESVQRYGLQKNVSQAKAECSATVLAFDIETTGLSRQTDRIIEFACRDFAGGRNSTFESLVNPGKKVTNSYIHGISSYMVLRSDVPSFENFIYVLKQFVASRQKVDKVLWVAHNGHRFDTPFLISECRRCGVEVPDNWFFLDTLPLARMLVNPDGSKLSSVSLESLKKHYGIVSDGPAHRAMSDVNTLCLVFQRITHDLKLTIPQLVDQARPASHYQKASPKPKSPAGTS